MMITINTRMYFNLTISDLEEVGMSNFLHNMKIKIWCQHYCEYEKGINFDLCENE
jgi:hypothetical protein